MKQIEASELELKMKNTSYLVGLRQVTRHLEKLGNHLGCVVVAGDAEQRIKSLVVDLCDRYQVELLEFCSMETLGAMAGIKVNCAVLGLL